MSSWASAISAITLFGDDLPPRNRAWGVRTASLRDPAEHIWGLAS
jgi:hypothetical protein